MVPQLLHFRSGLTSTRSRSSGLCTAYQAQLGGSSGTSICLSSQQTSARLSPVPWFDHTRGHGKHKLSWAQVTGTVDTIKLKQHFRSTHYLHPTAFGSSHLCHILRLDLRQLIESLFIQYFRPDQKRRHKLCSLRLAIIDAQSVSAARWLRPGQQLRR